MARLFHIDTFADCAYGGAPVPVIVHEGTMTAHAAKIWSGEFNQPVMAILTTGAAGYEVRFYEAGVEVGFVGTACLAAAFVALLKLGVACNAMVLKNSIDGDLRVSCEGGKFFVDLGAMAQTRVQSIRHLDDALPDVAVVERIETSFGAIAAVADEDVVRTLRPDLVKALELEAATLIVTAPGSDVDFVSRVFAPKFALPEDPVCGTAHRILAPYWATRLGRNRLSARQLCDRGGHFDCLVDGATVRLGGHAVLLFEGDIENPAPH